MRKIFAFVTIFMLVFSLVSCGDEESSSGDGTYVLGENAFGVHVTVRNITQDKILFIVDPHADEFGYEGKGEIEEGVFGTDGLIPGKRKGDNAVLKGSFTLYAHDLNGPSVTIEVDDTYNIDDLSNDFSTMHFYIFDGNQFTESTKDNVVY